MRLRQSGSLLFACLSLHACRVDLHVDDSSAISCRPDADDCPEDWSCNPVTRQCQRGRLDDLEAPAVLGEVTVTPPIATLAGFTVSFATTEPLLAPPRLWLVDHGEERLLESEPGDAPLVSRYTPLGDELPDEHSLFARMTDLAGNTSEAPLGEVVRFDFVAPAAGSVSVDYLRAGTTEVLHAAGPGTHVLVRFAASELVRQTPAPLVSATLGGTTLALALQEGNGLSFSYGLDVAAQPQGTYTLSVQMTDLAGNDSGPLTLPEALVIDTQAPPAPLTGIADAFVYHRAPWGTAAAPATAAASLTSSCASGTLLDTEVVTLVAVFGPPGAPEGEAGRGTVTGGCAASIALLPFDRPEISLVALDAAGNESVPALVRDIVWTATLGGEIAGSDVKNPHRSLSTGWMSGYAPLSSTELGAADGVAARGGAFATAHGGPSWREVPVEAPPFSGARGFGDMVFDPATSSMAVWGVPTPGFAWRWNGARGEAAPLQLDPEGDGGPNEQVGPNGKNYSVTYDTRRQLWVAAHSGLILQTWESGDGRRWSRRCPALGCVTDMPLDTGLSLFHDIRHDRILAFSRDAATYGPGDVWSWDGAVWEHLPSTSPPPSRLGYALGFDVERDVVVLFGGQNPKGGGCAAGTVEVDFNCYYDDVWEWDDGTWSEVTPHSPPWPGHTTEARFGYDSRTHELVMHGGYRDFGADAGPPCLDGNPRLPGGYCYLSETWAYDGAWRLLASAEEGDVEPSNPSTVFVANGPMAEDPLRGVMLLLWVDDATEGELWEWDGDRWRRQTTAGTAPFADLYRGAMTRDPDGGLLLVGGIGGAPPQVSGTWRYEGGAWRELLPLTTSNRYGLALGYHAGAGAALAFGGFSFGEVCDGAPSVECLSTNYWNAGWTVTNPGTTPDPRSDAQMVYDAARQRLVMLGGERFPSCDGGSDHCETLWEHDGAAWHLVTQLGPTVPVARHNFGLAYDEEHREVLLIGGTSYDSCDEDAVYTCTYTWAWSGTSWTLRLAEAPPEADLSTAHAHWSSAHREVALIDAGGRTYTWDGAHWNRLLDLEIDGDGAPQTMVDAMSSADERGDLLVFGGYTVPRGGWRLDSGALARPGHIFEVHTALAEAPSAASCLGAASCHLESVTVRWDGVATTGPRRLRLHDRQPFPVNVRFPVDRLPVESLHGLADAPAARRWTLVVRDYEPGEDGVLDGFCLYFGNAPAQCSASPAVAFDETAEARLSVDVGLDQPTGTLEVEVNVTHGRPADLVVDLVAEPISGAAIWLWREGAWYEAAHHTVGDAACFAMGSGCTVTATVAGPDAALLFNGPDELVRAALVPRDVNGGGPGYAQVASDYVELEMKYRLP